MGLNVWEVETVFGNSMSVTLIGDKGVFWSETGARGTYSQTLFNVVDGANLCCAKSLEFLGQVVRFPMLPRYPGNYVYFAVQNDQGKLMKLVNNWEANNFLLKIQGGPAVLDIPIVSFSEMQRYIDVSVYLGGRVDVIQNVCLEKWGYLLYQLGRQQFALFPEELKIRLDWYKSLLDYEHRVYSQLAAVV